MQSLGITVPSVVNRHGKARIDSTQRIFIGHDLFYFSNRSELARFHKNPLRYSRALTDPVTLVRFRPTAGSPHLEYHGRMYYFAAESTMAFFRADPDSFAIRRGM
jgi:YHS domain-containing protein